MAKRKYVSAKQPIGKEPIWESKKAPKQTDVVGALNWYSYNKNEKDAAKYLKTTPAIARNFLTLAWATRMKERGFKFTKESQVTIAEMHTSLTNALKMNKVTVTKDAPSIQDKINAKTESIVGEMEGLIDEFGIKGSVKDMNAYQWMIDNEVKSIHANRIVEHFQNAAAEVYVAATGKDAELAEGYSTYTPKRLLNLLQCYANIVKDAERLSHNVKQRKPRKKKPMSFDKKVATLNYMERDDSLKLVSVDPTKIIGASQVWVYNTKTRKLGLYTAFDGAGLDVKGSTLQNFSKDNSISKNLRKPEAVLTTIVGGGAVALRKVMDNIKAKSSKLTGRINRDTLILRVIA